MKSQNPKAMIQTLLPLVKKGDKRIREFNAEVICQICGKVAEPRGNSPKTQKYCMKCSEIASVKRRRKWELKNKPKSETIKATIARNKSRTAFARQYGAEINALNVKGEDWFDEPIPELVNKIRVSVPFSDKFSKNAIYRRDQEHVYLRKEAKRVREELAWEIRIAASKSGIEWHPNKMWIDLLVQKPKNIFDAVNVVDNICDAIQLATDINDRWISIRRLDWQLVFDYPKIFVGIGQEPGAMRICSYCGRILAWSNYTKAKHDKYGISRECRECRIEGAKRFKESET